MDKTGEVRFAIIGTNFIVKRFLEAAYLLDEFRFIALFSRDKEKGRTFTHDLKSIQVFDDLECLAKSDDVDAIYIASPNCCHASQSILMLENNKHVLCEKPIASNLLEWNGMLEASKMNNKIILEAMRPLYTPGYKVIKDHIKKIGTIRKVNFNFNQYSSRYNNFKSGILENAFKPELSNGALMDIGIYCVEVLVGLFGKPEQIFAKGFILPDSIDAMGNIIAIYDGMIANLNYSKITNSELPCEIQGEEGTIYFSRIFAPCNIKIKYNNGVEEKLINDTEQNDMVYEIKAFLNMIKGISDISEYNQISSIAMEFLDRAREQIGIVFPAD